MSNFVKETLVYIADKEVKEFSLEFMFYDFYNKHGGDLSIPRTTGRSLKELQAFLDSLPERAVNYDSGYGSQEWFGWISFKDGTWIERIEYDGSEWWESREQPSLG
jgi:hypothetical protein|uniref:Uncharacterized protein n=1 Tax=Podoviridae sp. ctiuS14 TaxID=2827620 RepID=A0A8S5LML1_9CAUD|nr:MAG TPA: hypothetical protein [Podoviridae sp. ctiuS14]